MQIPEILMNYSSFTNRRRFISCRVPNGKPFGLHPNLSDRDWTCWFLQCQSFLRQKSQVTYCLNLQFEDTFQTGLCVPSLNLTIDFTSQTQAKLSILFSDMGLSNRTLARWQLYHIRMYFHLLQGRRKETGGRECRSVYSCESNAPRGYVLWSWPFGALYYSIDISRAHAHFAIFGFYTTNLVELPRPVTQEHLVDL